MIDSVHLEPNIPSSKLLEIPQEFGWGLSDDLSTPTSGLTEVDRIASNLSCSEVRLSLTSGDTSSIVSVDIHKNGVSIFITPPTIDISGTTSVGATTPLLFISSASTVFISDDTELKFYVSGVTDCKGLKVKLIGNLLMANLPITDVPHTTVLIDALELTYTAEEVTVSITDVPHTTVLIDALELTYTAEEVTVSFIPTDVDALAFITAVGTLDATQEEAIDNLVIGLKANGTWTKYQAIYPFIGGTASSHKWNLIDPQDTDGAGRLTYGGTVTHNSNGIKGDGSTGYAETYLVPNVISTLENQSLGVYRNAVVGNAEEYTLGTYDAATTAQLISSNYGLSYVASLNGQFGQVLHSTIGISNSYFQATNIGGTLTMYVNGVSRTSLSSIGTLASTSFNIFRLKNVPTGYSAESIQIATIGDGLNATEVANDYTVIEAYQTALGRQA